MIYIYFYRYSYGEYEYYEEKTYTHTEKFTEEAFESMLKSAGYNGDILCEKYGFKELEMDTWVHLD